MSADDVIRVLIADDSAVSRRVLSELVSQDPGIAVVASVSNGTQAVAQSARLLPDVVLMDVQMPVMDGLDATRRLMQDTPCRIILVSELVGRDADLSFRALEAGALDLMRKPSRGELDTGDAADALLRKIRTYARVPVVRRHRRDRGAGAAASGDPTGPMLGGGASGGFLVCLGASTGGPPAIRSVLEAVDGRVRAPVLIAQHMTEGFIHGMASWLDGHLNVLRVAVAADGVVPQPGHVYLAPDNAHMQLENGRLRIAPRVVDASYRPSVNALFESVAESSDASRCVAALLTGMGEDGARGLLALRRAGALTIAQDEASSIVYGMPRAAHRLGAACESLPLERIGVRIRRFVASGTREVMS